MKFKSSCGPHAMLSRSTIKHARHYAPNGFNCLTVCSILGQNQASVILKSVIN